MSLDVYLTVKRWVSYDECKTFAQENTEVYSANITHNLGEMADKAGIYEAIWRPHRLKEGYSIPETDHDAEWKFEAGSITQAKDITPIIEKGLADMKARRDYYEQFNASNGWGLYKHFVPFVEEYLQACKKWPEAIVTVSR